MRIFLVRHGESEGNLYRSVYKLCPDCDIQLTDRGYKQAERAKEIITDVCEGDGFIIFSSPYDRAMQTARVILSVPPLVDYRLAEQQFGLFYGLDDEEQRIKCPEFFTGDETSRFFLRTPFGESGYDVVCRVQSALPGIRAAGAVSRNVVVVTHGVIVRTLTMLLAGHSLDWLLQEPRPGNGSVRLIDNGEDMGYLE